jgi:hypothetical protein
VRKDRGRGRRYALTTKNTCLPLATGILAPASMVSLRAGSRYLACRSETAETRSGPAPRRALPHSQEPALVRRTVACTPTRLSPPSPRHCSSAPEAETPARPAGVAALGRSRSGRNLLGPRRRASSGVVMDEHALDDHAGRVRVRDCRFLLADRASRRRDVVDCWLSSAPAVRSASVLASARRGQAAPGACLSRQVGAWLRIQRCTGGYKGRCRNTPWLSIWSGHLGVANAG